MAKKKEESTYVSFKLLTADARASLQAAQQSLSELPGGSIEFARTRIQEALTYLDRHDAG